MKLRLVFTLLILILAQGVVQAQRTTAPSPLTRAIIRRMVPLLQAEAAGGSSLDSKLAAVAMTKSDYTAYKNALLIAKLDSADPSRLTRNTLSVNVRKANVDILKELTESGVTIGPLEPVGPGTLTPCGVLCTKF